MHHKLLKFKLKKNPRERCPPVDESKILLKEAYFLQMLHFSQYTKNGEIVQKQIFEWVVAKVKVKN